MSIPFFLTDEEIDLIPTVESRVAALCSAARETPFTVGFAKGGRDGHAAWIADGNGEVTLSRYLIWDKRGLDAAMIRIITERRLPFRATGMIRFRAVAAILAAGMIPVALCLSLLDAQIAAIFACMFCTLVFVAGRARDADGRLRIEKRRQLEAIRTFIDMPEALGAYIQERTAVSGVGDDPARTVSDGAGDRLPNVGFPVTSSRS